MNLKCLVINVSFVLRVAGGCDIQGVHPKTMATCEVHITGKVSTN